MYTNFTISLTTLPQANPRQYDRVEDLTELVQLNEPSVLHVLRQRYGASLIHTFAGRHLIVINPMRQLASAYGDKVCAVYCTYANSCTPKKYICSVIGSSPTIVVLYVWFVITSVNGAFLSTINCY